MTADEYARAVNVARRACRGWTLSREDWEDVAQEAALRAWRTPDHFGSAAWWGAREAAERILRVRRKCRPVVVPLDRDRPAGVDVEGVAVGRVLAGWLLAGLPVEEREVVSLIDVEDRPWAEVERVLGVPDGTVARRRVRGLQRMRGLM